MNKSLIFSFTPNRSDYIKTLRAFSLQHASTKIAILLSILVVIAILLSVFYLHTLSLASSTVLLVMVIYYLTVFFLGPANVADKVAKDERQSSEMTWEVNEDAAVVCTREADTNCDWSTFGETFETNEYFLITYAKNKNMFQMVPKRAFKNADQLAEFHKLLVGKTKRVTKISAVNLPELSRNFSLALLYGIMAVFIIIVVSYGFTHGAGR
jgi:accessory gene regulator protein AgrB